MGPRSGWRSHEAATLAVEGRPNAHRATDDWHGRTHRLQSGTRAKGDKFSVNDLAAFGQWAGSGSMLPSEPGVILFEGFDSRGSLVVHRVALEGNKTIRGFQTAKSVAIASTRASPRTTCVVDGRQRRLRAGIASAIDDYRAASMARDGVIRDVLQVRRRFRLRSCRPFVRRQHHLWPDRRGPRPARPGRASIRQRARSPHPVLEAGCRISSTSCFDERREPVAARYYQAGRLVTEYFDEANRQMLEQWIRTRVPRDSTLTVIDRSDDGDQLILWVDGATTRRRCITWMPSKKRASLIDDMAPVADAGRLSRPRTSSSAKGTDGLPIEAFLTLPAGSWQAARSWCFPTAARWASATACISTATCSSWRRWATPCCRSTSAAPRATARRSARRAIRNYGRMIEDDIDAALRVALATYPLDEARMCILGASYGGYSALISAIRWPGRFRCAVSLSGVSDRALFFTASDNVRSEKHAAPAGAPAGQSTAPTWHEMQATSPLYHTDSSRCRSCSSTDAKTCASISSTRAGWCACSTWKIVRPCRPRAERWVMGSTMLSMRSSSGAPWPISSSRTWARRPPQSTGQSRHVLLGTLAGELRRVLRGGSAASDRARLKAGLSFCSWTGKELAAAPSPCGHNRRRRRLPPCAGVAVSCGCWVVSRPELRGSQCAQPVPQVHRRRAPRACPSRPRPFACSCAAMS